MLPLLSLFKYAYVFSLRKLVDVTLASAGLKDIENFVSIWIQRKLFNSHGI